MPARLGQVLCVSVAAMLTMAAQTKPPVMVEMRLVADGSVQVDGKSYSNLNELELKLLELSHRMPKPSLLVRFPNVPYPYQHGYGIVALIHSSGLDTSVDIWPVVLPPYADPAENAEIEKEFQKFHEKKIQHARKHGSGH